LSLLLLHGTAGSSHCWQPLLERLDPEVGVLVPDLPGHGASRCHRHSRHGIEDMAADLAELLHGLGYNKVDVVAGHSAGAAIALALALGSPAGCHGASGDGSRQAGGAQAPSRTGARGLIVGTVLGIAPSLVPPPPLYTTMLGPLLAPLVGSTPSIAAAALLARTTGLTDRLLASTGSTIAPAQRERYRQLLKSRAHVRGAVDFMTATRLPDLLARLSGLACPSHFLIADDDPWIPAGALRDILSRHLPQAELEGCRGGHLLPESRPELVANHIKQLLATSQAANAATPRSADG